MRPDNNEYEEAMNLHNNAIGRQIAQNHPAASTTELLEYARRAVRDGRTIAIYRGKHLKKTGQYHPDDYWVK